MESESRQEALDLSPAFPFAELMRLRLEWIDWIDGPAATAPDRSRLLWDQVSVYFQPCPRP